NSFSCPKAAGKVSSLGKNWHRFCLKCERCNRTLSAGGHAEHDGMPYCHQPCYATLFGPKGVNIGGAGSYIYDTPPTTPSNRSSDSTAHVTGCSNRLPSHPLGHIHVSLRRRARRVERFSPPLVAEPTPVFFQHTAEKVMSLGRNWHRPCLRCERCRKTLTPGGHAEHEGRPYCHVPCYGYLFGPKGVNIGEVGCYIYDKDQSEQNELSSHS
uniref:Cysteine-rich protein 3 n=1 Tax=Scleropages formosus TaxID=113540 RepID=A0A8C9T4D8_SCLFO